jgi:hypothetical protein
MSWRQALDTQTDLRQMWENTKVLPWLRTSFRIDHVANDEESAANMALQIRESEWRKLAVTPPYWISEDACTLIQEASKTFQPEPLLATDLLTPSGIIVFAKPMDTGVLVNPDLLPPNITAHHLETPVTCRVITWCPVSEMDDAKSVIHYDNDEHRQGIAFAAYECPQDFGSTVQNMGLPYLPIVVQGIPFYSGWQFGNIIPTGETAHSHNAVHAIFQVASRLITQRVMSQTTQGVDRHTRKRAMRADIPFTEVNVVDLPRRVSSSNPQGTGVEYTHRWMVAGHWRNQWYPSLGTHRQRWIHGYVKGPDDKPLVVKQRVFQR